MMVKLSACDGLKSRAAQGMETPTELSLKEDRSSCDEGDVDWFEGCKLYDPRVL